MSAPATPADAAPGTPEASPPAGEAATPEATPSGPEFVLRPADPTSVFQSCQVIAYYGYPDIPVMGILGSGEPDAVVHQLLAQAAEYDAVNGDRGVAPALHLIYAVAQGSPTDDGTYLYRMPDELVRRYIDAAERLNILLILDIQMGHSTVDAELPHVLPYLEDPRVHLALDPEFAMPNGEVPGTIIGTLDASEINKAQHALRKVVEEHRLPNKILVVHQFRHEMISNKQAIEDVPNVDLVIDMDGFGGQFPKTDGYRMFVNEDGAEHGGFKLFYDQDVDLLTPEQVSHLDPQPDLVIYQ